MLGGGGRCGGVMGRAAPLPPRPGRSWVPPDLVSSDSSMRSDDEDSILCLLAAPTPRSMLRLPRPLVRGVVSSTASLPRALLQDSSPGVVFGFRVSVPRPHLCKGSRLVSLLLLNLPLLWARLSTLAPRQL